MNLKLLFTLLISMLFFPTCKEEKEPVLPAGLITISPITDNSPADDKQYNKLLVNIDPSYINAVPTFTVSTNLGSVLSSNLTFDEDGNSYVYLKSAVPGTADVVVVASGRSFHGESRFKDFTNGFIGITPLTDFSPADDNSYNKLSVKLDTAFLSAIPDATVSSSLGSFLNTTLHFDQEGRSLIYIKSQQAGTGDITVTVKNKAFYTTTHFTTSYPDYLNMNLPGSISNALGEKINITFSLKKQTGKVSANIPVSIVAKDKADNKKGSFSNFTTSDANGTVTGEYWLQDTLYTGFVTFYAAVLNQAGDTAAKSSNKVLVVKSK